MMISRVIVVIRRAFTMERPGLSNTGVCVVLMDSSVCQPHRTLRERMVIDLRKSKPGSYFLSTTHEQDQASYYYPLQIK